MDSLQLLFMVFAASLGPASATPDSPNARLASPPLAAIVPAASAQFGFDARTRVLIQDYYRSNPSSLPPGLAKKGALPRGEPKQLERNGHLPPGIDKQSLPPELVRQLPPLPRGYDRMIVGADIVLVEVSTQTVVDVLHGVFG